MMILIEEADFAIFATYDELPQVGQFFTQAWHRQEHMGRVLCQQQVPFPRLHFFTMASAMGQPLQDGEILVPAVTVGEAGQSGIPVEKYQWHGPRSPFIFADAQWQPLTERALPSRGLLRPCQKSHNLV